MSVLLVNPNIALPTGPVFRAWDGQDRGGLTGNMLSEMVFSGRNDLQAPAIYQCPEIADILETLKSYDPQLAQMSGSGATCFALFSSENKCLEAQATYSNCISAMVDDGWEIAMSEPYRLIGTPQENAVLIVADHASNHVPAHIDLGLDQVDLTKHIAWDIGVAQVADIMCKNDGFAAILGTASRLVVDLNRHEHEDAVIPVMSDGIAVPGNALGPDERQSRIEAHHRPYHRALADILQKSRPALILSLHSFTNKLQTKAMKSDLGM